MSEHHENEKSMIFKKNVENEKMQNLRKTIFRGWRELAGALRELFCKLFQNFGGGGSLRELAGAYFSLPKMQNLRKTVFPTFFGVAGACRSFAGAFFQAFPTFLGWRELAGACGSFRELGFSIFLSFSLFHFLGF